MSGVEKYHILCVIKSAFLSHLFEPRQLFFNDSIHIFMDTPVAEDGLSVQGRLTKTQKAAPTAPNSGERPGFRAEES